MRRYLEKPTAGLLDEESDAPVVLGDIQSVASPPLKAALGRTEDGAPLALDVAQLPHLSIAGTSGAGKSTLLRTLLASYLMASTPDDLRLLLVDMDGEFEDLRGIPHLQQPPIDDTAEAADALDALAVEMDNRRSTFHAREVYNIDDYNALGNHLPKILCIVDEFAAMMYDPVNRKRVETAVAHIGMRGRKYGIHIILATQIPYADVMTKAIRANMQGRIGMAVNDATASRVAIGVSGAEALPGNGAALLKLPDSKPPLRFQVAWVSRERLKKVVAFWKFYAELEEAASTPAPVAAPDGDTSLAGALAVDTSKLPTGRWVPLRPQTAPLPPKPYAGYLRALRTIVLTLAALGAVYGYFSAMPNQNGCPGNSSYSNTSLE